MTKEEIVSRIKNYKDKNGNYYKYINGIALRDIPFKQAFAVLKRLESKPILPNKVDQQLSFNFT